MNKVILRLLKFFVRRLARTHGFLDPFDFLSKISRFGQPSEVAVPTELLRAGAVMHARGLLNSQVIQYNMDWVWPYWVNRQFDPRDSSFVPRAFSLSHINLTHRNWTAVGLPGLHEMPIVDPRGLLTPFWDSWSIDCSVIRPGGTDFIPSREQQANQELDIERDPVVRTWFDREGLELSSEISAIRRGNQPVCEYNVTVESDESAWLVVTVRPYNPEGISFINSLQLLSEPYRWLVNDEHEIQYQDEPDRHALSNYDSGDVYKYLPDFDDRVRIDCDVGLASLATLYKLTPNSERDITLEIPLTQQSDRWSLITDFTETNTEFDTWTSALDDHCSIRIPDERIAELYDISLRTLILHSPDEIYPGPFTYRRFWFRDAAYIINALMVSNLNGRVRNSINNFLDRQNSDGYFSSQKGEWDSNGEALWAMNRYCELSDELPEPPWVQAIKDGAQWILDKRLPADTGEPHQGLLPAGFSAEHFGPNDYYYWDDFWAVAGLQSAADMLESSEFKGDISTFRREAVDLFDCVFGSVLDTTTGTRVEGIPASPYRSMDAGAIGSLVASYPLQLVSPKDDRLLETADFLYENCFVEGAFFQEMIHSGLNPYLSLHVAQVYLRAGYRDRCWEILQSVADLASSTGQWPEAVHPETKGGCMGDGQHAWAAADWNMIIRNLFVREERDDYLILGSGLPEKWIRAGDVMEFGPTRTRFGVISVRFEPDSDGVDVTWDADWFDEQPTIIIDLPASKIKVTSKECRSTFVEEAI